MKRIKVAMDCNVSRRVVGMIQGLYGDQGYEFTMVADLVLPRTQDEHWADVFKRFGGEVVLSGDPKIGYRAHQALAFINNGFISFFLAPAWATMMGHAQAAHIAYCWPAIHAKIGEGQTGRNWRVPCLGKGQEVRLVPKALEEMIIPDEVLSKTSQSKIVAAS